MSVCKNELSKSTLGCNAKYIILAASSSSKPATPSSGAGVQLEDLQSILRNMGGAPTPVNPVDLSEAMKADDIIPMLANEQIR